MVNIDLLFEVSWEVCNKVGGIYTVVSSKIMEMLKHYQYNSYYTVGPYFEDKAKTEFQEKDPPDEMKQAFDELKNEGIVCHYGIWFKKGKPQAILIDYSQISNRKDEIKGNLWDTNKIDSLKAGSDFDDPAVWCYCVSKLIEKMVAIHPSKKIIGHFHEWLAGIALLMLKSNNVKVGTVFTTHATMLGRSLAGSGYDLYSEKATSKIKKMDLEKEARDHGVLAKYLVERECAKKAEVFTTVSEITGEEAKLLLGKKPNVLLPNGLDFDLFPDKEEIPINHKVFRSRIQEFVVSYFFPYYSFDLEKTLFLFTASRYEFHNKGLDVAIEALGQLNERMRKENVDKTIVAFFFIPADTKGIRTEILESKDMFDSIQHYIEENLDQLKRKVVLSIASHQIPGSILDEDTLFEIKKQILYFKKEGDPPLSTHYLKDEGNDSIMNALKKANLLNKVDDKVKIVFYPTYISSTDGLINLSYYNLIWGCHLGIFASFYEPWGYTPLESGAFGVPCITTDLAGFGRFVKRNYNVKENSGLYVVDVNNRSKADIVKDLNNTMFWYATLEKKDRIQNKLNAENFVRECGWDKLIINYFESHQKAAEKVFG